jgi:hypothetical protein
LQRASFLIDIKNLSLVESATIAHLSEVARRCRSRWSGETTLIDYALIPAQAGDRTPAPNQPSRVSNVAGYPPQWMLEQALLLSIHFRVASSVQPGTAKPGVATP